MPSTNLGMRVHHTKNKGDLGVLHAQLDLAKRGWTICLPQTEHAEFDLIAYKDGRFLRVQVKYRAAVNGLVAFPLTTCWADKHGVHSVAIDKNAIDVFCVYCPDTDRCYYVEPRKVSRSVHIRISPPRNSQVKRIHLAEDFTEIPKDCGVSAPSTTPLVRGGCIRHSREPKALWGFARAHSSSG